MTHRKQFLIAVGLFGLLAILVSGCYTQLGTTKDEREKRGEYTSSQQDNDNSNIADDDDENYDRSEYYANNDYDEYGEYYRPRVGFSYYYPSSYWPSTAFSMAYASPWAYDCYWAYSPWYCGTPYVTYPIYGYYPPSYYYPPYYYRYSNSYAIGSARRGTRDFGSTRYSGGRGATETRFDSPTSGANEIDLPRAARVGAPLSGPTPSKTTPTVKDNGRRTGSQRGGYVPKVDGRSGSRSDSGVRGANTRGGNSRTDARRYRTPDAPSAPSAGNRTTSGDKSTSQPQSHGSRDAGGSRTSSTPSYTPPAPQHSSPPAPAPRSSGRGGDTRGRRP